MRAVPVVRASLRFSHAQYASEPVRRCALHRLAASDPMLLCDHPLATYESDLYGHAIVCLPLTAVEATLWFRVACFTSCRGGIARRATALVLTAWEDDRLVGAASVSLRCCACPARDLRLAEKTTLCNVPFMFCVGFLNLILKASEKGKGKEKGKEKERQANASESEKERETEESAKDRDVFVLRVRGKENYMLLKTVAAALEMYAHSSRRRDPTPLEVFHLATRHSIRIDPEINPVQSGSDTDLEEDSVQKCSSLKDALAAARLEQYAPVLRENGIGTVAALAAISRATLDRCRIARPGHRRKLEQLARLCARPRATSALRRRPPPRRSASAAL